MKKMYSRKELLKDGMFVIRSSVELMKEAGLKGDFDEMSAFYERASIKATMLDDLDLISVDKLFLLRDIIDRIFMNRLIAGLAEIKKA